MFNHAQGPNLYQKPPTVAFTFAQKRFDKTGELRDERGTVIYHIRDLGEEHTFGFVKSYPLEIRRASDNQLVATLTWNDKPKKTTVEGLTGQHGVVKMEGGLLDEDMKWKMPDGSLFEWDGVYGNSFTLLDNRIAAPFSLTPAVVAIWTPRPTKKDFASLEIHRDALSVPGFLDYVVVTSIFIEWSVYFIASNEAADKAGTKFGNEIGSAIAGG